MLEGHFIVLVDDHVALEVLNNNVLGLDDLLVLDFGERCEDLGDIAPPLLAELLVPVDGSGKSRLEWSLLVPAEVAELRAVDSVAAIVEWTVVGVLNPLVKLLLGGVGDLKVSQELGAEGKVGDLVVRADIVNLANGTLVENGVKGVSGVAGEEVTAGWGAITVEDEWLATVQQAGELRDDLCRKVSNWFVWRLYKARRLTLWELVRTVDVVAADDDDWELEALLVRVHQHLCGGLGGGVWVGWGEDAALEEIIIVILNFSVDLIGRDVDEALDPDLLSRLEKNVSAVDVGVGETVRVSETQVNVGLRGEVEDGVNIVALEAVHDLRGVRDVAMVEGEVSLIVQDAGIVERCAVVQLVEGDDVVGIGVCERQVTYQPTCTGEERCQL